jgi:uncharacterized SAM-binding protein YcdF (DUF218 family)
VLVVSAAMLFPRLFLEVSHPPGSADALVVLGGEPITRTRAAAPLLTNGFAPRVILSGTGDCEENGRLLKQFGVQTNVIELECKSTSTQENALYTVELLRAHKCQRVIIVTSWFHSRRALSCFRKYAPEIEFISVPTPAPVSASQRFSLSAFSRIIAAEYAKMIVYAFRYGIVPWKKAETLKS